jgi:hypothetical protein
MLPMYQSEAMWLNFNSRYIEDNGTEYPFAIKVATGKINALTGNKWSEWLQKTPQDYMVAPKQPWLDGYCVEKGLIRQFIAMPLGSGYSVEEQLTDEALYGGIQIIVFPMKRQVFEKRFPKRVKRVMYDRIDMNMKPIPLEKSTLPDMGLAPGGRMRQEIYEDPFDLDDWEMEQKNRCFVHIANSLVWREITNDNPPTAPITAKEYEKHGLPWFEYYRDDLAALGGSSKLNGAGSIAKMANKKSDNALTGNQSVLIENIVKLTNVKKEPKIGNEVLEFSESIGAVDMSKVLKETFGASRLFKRRNYFVLNGDRFFIIKISRTERPFWGLGKRFIDFFNDLTKENGIFYFVALVSNKSGWVFSKNEVNSYIEDKSWSFSVKTREYKINDYNLKDNNNFTSINTFLEKITINSYL